MIPCLRLPKWLTEERFEVLHDPEASLPIRVRLFKRRDRVYSRAFDGYGVSIGKAAKEAMKLRDEKHG